MNISIKEVLEELQISRSKLYILFKDLDMKTQKVKNKTMLSIEQVSQIREFLECPETSKDNRTTNTKKDRSGKDTVQDEKRQSEDSKNSYFYQKRVEELQKELKNERQEKAQITLLLGKAQGEAIAYKEQSQKLLEFKDTVEQKEEKKSFWARVLFRK